jgi:hypothetical protein
LGLPQGDVTLAGDSHYPSGVHHIIDLTGGNQMAEAVAPAATWKRVVASILDFFTIFIAGGYVIARLTGGMTEDGFNLKGGPAFVLFAAIIIYFVVGRLYAGGTLWDRIFRIARPQPQ